MLDVSIIILSYNTKSLTLACINSITKQYKDELQKGKFEIIVVDNASMDSTVSSIRGKSAARIIENKENYGFSKGSNAGAKQAKGRYLFFLNSDTQIENDGLIGMVNFLDTHKNVGILGGGLEAGRFYNILTVFIMLLGGERLGLGRFSPKKEMPVDWVSGASFMILKDTFMRLGGFDERLFMYMEDMELCFRALKQGLLTYYYPYIAITHKKLASSNRAFAILHIYTGLLYFFKKYNSFWQYCILNILLRIKAIIAILLGIITQNDYLKNTYKKALFLPL